MMGCRGDPSGQAGESSGEPSMQEGMMDGDGRVAPTYVVMYWVIE